MPRTAQPFRTNVLLPRSLYTDLKAALKRRRKLEELNGRESAVTFSAWIREKARETVKAYQ